jgi:hypothetical protein
MLTYLQVQNALGCKENAQKKNTKQNIRTELKLISTLEKPGTHLLNEVMKISWRKK